MNRRLVATAILLSVLSSGCGTFWEIAAKNLVEAPLNAASDCARKKHLTDLANKAYHEFEAEHPDEPCSDDFCTGFIDGFVDYVESGGDGQAPPTPPWRYTRARYDSTEGRQAMQDYYSGFRHGSAVALDSGLRDLVVIYPGQAPAPATDPDQKRLSNQNSGGSTEPTLPQPRMEPADGAADTQSEKKP